MPRESMGVPWIYGYRMQGDARTASTLIESMASSAIMDTKNQPKVRRRGALTNGGIRL